ncbi:Coiled-coil domain-containing protein 12 [Pseudolycoriella hygida]|uniref:Coiled-coil domain-containing protein 12 n=1 Tax=Pseudolycoriella hygida TaxID=35572 RepID=A0A9Q0RZ95_9DIPT|nr:Coiled-coil domain-containing protein 12 [Pseudolycoriella hygida]
MADSTNSEKLGSMEEEAIKRKERLLALKRKATSDKGSQDNEVKIPKFRSYKPQDESILENAILAEAAAESIETEVQDQLDMLKTPIVIDEIDIVNLAPRKPDWDLKRDVSKKLEKLEKQTQRAIAELIRERLKNNQSNMLEMVNVATAEVKE